MAIRLLVIAGPTACGKTRLGVTVARALGSEIISADSRQTYRGLDIGSGKDLDEYRRVDPPIPHHLIDVADPHTPYSVFLFQRDCYRVLEASRSRVPFANGAPMLMVGGSGLYIEAVLQGYRIANVPEDPELRERLTQCDHDELIEELRTLDADLLERTDVSSTKRVVRAIEIATAAREQTVRRSEVKPAGIDHAVFVVEVPRDELHRRIDARLEERVAQGMIDEVERLLAAGVTPERMDQLGLEYREVTALLLGKKTEEQMLDDLRRGIRRFAKRQRTWFRGMPGRGIEVTWIGPDDAGVLLGHTWADG